MRKKQVQIDEELFVDLCKYFMLGENTLSNKIINGLENKLDKIVLHNLYSQYKDKTVSKNEREQARKKYLDTIGINKDFRW